MSLGLEAMASTRLGGRCKRCPAFAAETITRIRRLIRIADSPGTGMPRMRDRTCAWLRSRIHKRSNSWPTLSMPV